MKNKILYLGADHAGFRLKEKIKKWLEKKKISFEDLGNKRYDKDDDYPDFAQRVARATVKNKSMGILLCGSAEGMCIAANKIKGARAVAPYSSLTARLSREHNNANIICLSGGGTLKPIPGMPLNKARAFIKAFLDTPFSREPRHIRRLNKIKRLERK